MNLPQFTTQLWELALNAQFQPFSARINAFNAQAIAVHAALLIRPTKLSANPAKKATSLTKNLNCASLLAPQISSTIFMRDNVRNALQTGLSTLQLKIVTRVPPTAHHAFMIVLQNWCSAPLALVNMKSIMWRRHADKAATAHNITTLIQINAYHAKLVNTLTQLLSPAQCVQWTVLHVPSIVLLNSLSVSLAKMDHFSI